MCPAKHYHHGNLEIDLVLTALQLIEARGIEDVSLRDVAKNCGVSATAVYRHFASKEQMLIACAAEGYRRLANEMAKRSADFTSPERKIIELGMGYLIFAYKHRNLYRFMFSADLSAASPSQREIFSESYAMLHETVADGIKKKKFRGTVDTVAFKAWSLVHGFAMLVIANRIPTKNFDEFKRLARKIFAGTIE